MQTTQQSTCKPNPRKHQNDHPNNPVVFTIDMLGWLNIFKLVNKFHYLKKKKPEI